MLEVEKGRISDLIKQNLTEQMQQDATSLSNELFRMTQTNATNVNTEKEISQKHFEDENATELPTPSCQDREDSVMKEPTEPAIIQASPVREAKKHHDHMKDDEHKIVYEGERATPGLLLDDGFIDLARLEPGGCFGELALVDGKPRMATIKCITRCHFLVLNRTDYAKALREQDKKRRQ